MSEILVLLSGCHREIPQRRRDRSWVGRTSPAKHWFQGILLSLLAMRHSNVKTLRSSGWTSAQEEWTQQDNYCRGRWGHTNLKNESNSCRFVTLQCYDSLKNNLQAKIKDLFLAWITHYPSRDALWRRSAGRVIQQSKKYWAYKYKISGKRELWEGWWSECLCYSLRQKGRREAEKPTLAGGVLLLYPVVSVGVWCFCKMDCQQRRNQWNCQENYFLGKSG